MKKHKQVVDLMRNKPTQQRASATVEVIFDAATQILDSIGPSKLTTNRIAERAGVSVGTVYYFFPNKTAIIEGLALRELYRLEQALQDVIQRPSPLGKGENVTRTLRAYFSVFGAAGNGRHILYKYISECKAPSVVADVRDKLHATLFNAVFKENANGAQVSPIVQRMLFRGLLAILQEAVEHFPSMTGFIQIENELRSLMRGIFRVQDEALGDRNDRVTEV